MEGSQNPGDFIQQNRNIEVSVRDITTILESFGAISYITTLYITLIAILTIQKYLFCHFGDPSMGI